MNMNNSCISCNLGNSFDSPTPFLLRLVWSLASRAWLAVRRPALAGWGALALLLGPGLVFPVMGRDSTGVALGQYTINTTMNPSSAPNYATVAACGDTCWYSYVCPTAGGNYNRPIQWRPGLPTYGCTGRMWVFGSYTVPSAEAEATVYFHSLDGSGNENGTANSGGVNECAYSCNSITFVNGNTTMTSFGGWAGNTSYDGGPGAGGCNTACGYYVAGYGPVVVQAARWQYIDDWTCLGPFNSTGIEDSSSGGRSFPFGEAGLYFYPGLDTSHGNTISAGLGFRVGTSEVTSGNNGTTAAVASGRVTTGDCNNANVLNFGGSVGGVSPAGNAAAYGNANNADAYACAWIYANAGAGPKIALGADDHSKVWINGTVVSDNQTTCCTIDNYISSSGVGIAAGWNRVLFKIHNGGGGWNGTVSFRNGGNSSWNEPNLNAFDFGSYYSYGLGYEQDAWFPTISPSSVYGASSPANAASLYGNSTTVGASGTSAGAGPVPYWQTMQYMWGNGLGGVESSFAAVTGTPTSTSWSDSRTGVTGHRRFHYFAVSQSGRTSGQASGQTGGWTFDSSHAKYYDVYVDNVAPVAPIFSSVTAASTTQINLAWAIPLDQGVNVANGSTESSGNAGALESQNWYIRGDVGTQVYRGGSTTISAWSGSTTSSVVPG